MKKGLLSVALILTTILALTFFTRNKARAYYGGPYSGYGSYSIPYGDYSGFSTHGSLSGGYGTYANLYSGYSMYSGASQGFSYSPYSGSYGDYGMYGGLYGGYTLDPVGTPKGPIYTPGKVNEPSPPEVENSSSGSHSTQKSQWPEIINIPSPIMPAMVIDSTIYLGFPANSEQQWYKFLGLPSLSAMPTLIPGNFSAPDWPFAWPMPTTVFPDNISIPWLPLK